MGVYKADSGSMTLAGRNIVGDTVKDNLSHGIAMIFQELSLLPNLTVGDNILIGREPRRAAWIVDRRSSRREAQAIIDRYRFPLRAAQVVRELGFAQRQMVEILKAVSRGARVLVLDEPTSSLSLREEEKLFTIVDDLKASGIGLVYISHRMAEIFRLADRLSIVKDGRIIGPLDPNTTSIRQVSELMSKSKVAGRGRRPFGSGGGAGRCSSQARRRDSALGRGPLHGTQTERPQLHAAAGRDPRRRRSGWIGALDLGQVAVRPSSRRRRPRLGSGQAAGARRSAQGDAGGPRLRSRGPPPRGPRPEFHARQQHRTADPAPPDAKLRPACCLRSAHPPPVR